MGLEESRLNKLIKLKRGKKKMCDENVRNEVANYLILYRSIRPLSTDDETAWAILREIRKDRRLALLLKQWEGCNLNKDSGAECQLRLFDEVGAENAEDLTKGRVRALVCQALAEGSG